MQRSLVAHRVRVAGVASSNLVIPIFYAKNRFPSRTYVRVLLVRIKRAYGFCFFEFHSFRKSPSHSAHSRNLVIPIFKGLLREGFQLTLIFYALKMLFKLSNKSLAKIFNMIAKYPKICQYNTYFGTFAIWLQWK